MWDAKKDKHNSYTSVTQQLHLVHVYMKNQWKSSTMECKNIISVNCPQLIFDNVDFIKYTHKTCDINLFTNIVKCSLFCTVLIFLHKQCVMGAGWVGDTSDWYQNVSLVIDRVMERSKWQEWRHREGDVWGLILILGSFCLCL